MASLEVRLVSNILKNQDMKALVKAGVSEEDFQTEEARDWYRYLCDVSQGRTTFGEVPSVDKFQRRFPTFDYAPTTDSVASLCDEVLQNNLKIDGEMMSEDVLDALATGDTAEAIRLASNFVNFWTRRKAEGGDLDLAHSSDVLKEQYERVEFADGMLGIPWPWEPVNRETLGMQKQQLIVLYGRPKSMKTWVALYIGVYAYLFCNARVMFYSREMDPVQVLRRAASMIAGLDYGDVKRAELTKAQKEELFDALEMLKDEEHGKRTDGKRAKFIISNDRGSGANATVNILRQKAEDEQVDLLIVDAVYKLSDQRTRQRDSDWKTQANIVQDLKDCATDLDIPVIAVTQANRKAGKKVREVDTSEAAFTDAVGMECDLMCRLIKSKDEATGESELILVWPAARDEELHPFMIHACPGYNFELKRARLTEEDINRAVKKEGSEKAEDDQAPKESGRRRRQSGLASMARGKSKHPR